MTSPVEYTVQFHFRAVAEELNFRLHISHSAGFVERIESGKQIWNVWKADGENVEQIDIMRYITDFMIDA